MLEKGTVFAEKYEILECLSSSAQAIVYKALQKPLDRVVILKTLFPALTTNPEIVARFEREAKLLSAINDESVTKIFDFGKHNGVYFFVSEYIEGISIKELIERKGRLSSQFTSYIILESAKILARLHNQGIIHRDLKPGNILLSQNGKVILTDFGLALSQAMPSITIEGSILGTPSYMSPEQILGKPVDKKSDIYSLGVVFYELLTGINPFLGENYSAIMHNVLNLKPIPVYKTDKALEKTKDLWQIIEQMIDKYPQSRFNDMSEVCIKLDLWFNNPENRNWKLTAKERQFDEKIFSPPPRNREHEAGATKATKQKTKIKRVFLVPTAIFLLIIILFAVNKIQNKQLLVNDRKSNQPFVDSIRLEPYLIKQKSDSDIIHKTTQESTSQSRADSTVLSAIKVNNTVNQRPEIVLSGQNSLAQISSSQTNIGFLKIAVIPWATIFIDGREIYTTPKDTLLEILAGLHNIKLVNPNFPVLESIVTIEANKSIRLSFDLTERVSYLQISVQPWADVYIDGSYKTTTPISSPIILPSGTHRITLRNPYYQVCEETITFKPKQTIERNIVLK